MTSQDQNRIRKTEAILRRSDAVYFLNKHFPGFVAMLVNSAPKESPPVAEIPDGAKKVGRCWECDTFGPIHDHHVVPQIHNGTKTVPLCETCHGKVHGKDLSNHRSLTIAGMRAAKDRGVRFGRPSSSNTDWTETVRLWLEEKEKGRTLRAFCKEHGVSTSTLRRAVARAA